MTHPFESRELIPRNGTSVTHPFSTMTNHLYDNIVDLWNVSDSMGKVSKKIYKEYQETCVSLEECREKELRMRREFDQLTFNKEYVMNLKTNFNRLRKHDQTRSDEMDTLRKTIEELRYKNRLCESEKQTLKGSFESGISKIRRNIKRYSNTIEKIKKSAEETNAYMKKSTSTISGILENHCDNTTTTTLSQKQSEHLPLEKRLESASVELVGSGSGGKTINYPPLNKEQFKLLSRRKRNRYVSINKDIDSIYDTNNHQWVLLSECITGMNKIVSMDDRDVRGYMHHRVMKKPSSGKVLLVPEQIKKTGLARSYLLFLRELQYLSRIPRKDFLYMKDLLKLDHGVKTIRDLKNHFSDDIYRLNKILVTM